MAGGGSGSGSSGAVGSSGTGGARGWSGGPGGTGYGGDLGGYGTAGEMSGGAGGAGMAGYGGGGLAGARGTGWGGGGGLAGRQAGVVGQGPTFGSAQMAPGYTHDPMTGAISRTADTKADFHGLPQGTSTVTAPGKSPFTGKTLPVGTTVTRTGTTTNIQTPAYQAAHQRPAGTIDPRTGFTGYYGGYPTGSSQVGVYGGSPTVTGSPSLGRTVPAGGMSTISGRSEGFSGTTGANRGSSAVGTGGFGK